MTMTVERMSRAEVEAALQHEIAVSREYGLVIVDLRAEIERLTKELEILEELAKELEILEETYWKSACKHAEKTAEMQAEIERLREVVMWYGEQARLARLIHSEGDAGRNALAADGGQRARAALDTEDK